MPKITTNLDAAKARREASDKAVDHATIAEKASGTGLPEGQKYKAAVDLAKQTFGTDAYTQKQLRDEIDRQLVDLGSEYTGAQFRNENPFTQFVRFLDEGMDDWFNWVGNGLDSAFDNSLAKVLPGEAENWFTGEELAVLPDIAMTLGLSAIPFVGPGLAVGKATIQNSDNAIEALTGRDAVTLEQLSGMERAGKGASTVLDAALSGFGGKAFSSAGKAAEKAGAKAGAEAVEQGAKEAAEKTVAEAASNVPEGAKVTSVASKGKLAKKAAEEGAEEVIEEATEAAAKASPMSKILESIKANQKAVDDLESEAKAMSALRRLANGDSLRSVAWDSFKNIPQMRKTLPMAAGAPIASTAASAASRSEDLGDFFENLSDPEIPGSLLPSLTLGLLAGAAGKPLTGAGMRARGNVRDATVGSKDRVVRNAARNNRYNAIQASSLGDQISQLKWNDEDDIMDDYGNQAVIDNLDALLATRTK